MAQTIKPLLGTTNQGITITLNSLAASATAGRQSTVVDNRTNLYDDILVQLALKFATGTVSSSKAVYVYVAATANDTDYFAEYSSTGTSSQQTLGTTDAAFTRADPTNLRLLGVIGVPFVASTTTNAVYISNPMSVAAAFGGTLPAQFAIVVFDDTGVALHSSGNSAWYQGVQYQAV